MTGRFALTRYGGMRPEDALARIKWTCCGNVLGQVLLGDDGRAYLPNLGRQVSDEERDRGRTEDYWSVTDPDVSPSQKLAMRCPTCKRSAPPLGADRALAMLRQVEAAHAAGRSATRSVSLDVSAISETRRGAATD
jgi:hypothetical protein